jgi:lysyl-tRNA synthetase class 2
MTRVTDSTHPDQPSVSEQMQVRRDKRNRIIADGGQAYPVRCRARTPWRQCASSGDTWSPGEETDDEVVSVSGRIMFLRNTGKLCFATLADQFTPTPTAAACR